MNKYGRLIKNAIVFGLGSLSVKLVQFLVMPILTAYLSVDDYGINEILNNVIDLGIPILTLGIAESLFRFSIDENTSQSEVFTNGMMTMLGCIGITVLVVPITYYFIRETYVILMMPWMILTSLRQLVAEFTRGRGKVVVYSVGGMINSFAMLAGAAVFLIPLKMGITGYVLSCILGNIVVLIYYLIFANPVKFFNLKDVNRIKLKAMIKFSLPNVPNMFSWWLVQTSSKYILIGFSGLSVASLYMASSKIPALINIVSTIFLQAWSLSSSEESNTEDRDEFYSRIFRYYSFLVLFAVAAIIALTPYVSMLLLQGEFYEAWTYSPILILSGGLGCFSAFFGAFYSAFYNTKTAMYTTFIGGGANLLLSLILIPFYGVYGAMVGNLVGYALIVFTRVWTTRKYVHIKANWVKVIFVLLLLLGQSIVYTVNMKYAYIVSIVAMLIIILLYLKEIKELIEMCIGVIKKLFGKGNSNVTEIVGEDGTKHVVPNDEIEKDEDKE